MLLYDDDQDANICLVDFDKVTPDQAFQRDEDPAHIARLMSKVARFVSYAVLSYRNGHLYVADGQHRIAVKKLHNKKIGLAIVLTGLSVAETAEVYTNQNTYKRPDNWNLFKASIAAGDPHSKSMQSICTNNNLTLKWEFGATADLIGLSSIEEAYRSKLLENWCKILNKSFKINGVLHKDAKKQPFQRGLIDLLKRYGSRLNVRRIISDLKCLEAGMIWMEAISICTCGRVERSHVNKVMEKLLRDRGALPTSLSDAA